MQKVKNETLMVQPLATKKQAANFFSVTERTIDRLRKKGILKGIKIGKKVRFKWEDLQQLSYEEGVVKND